MTGYRMISTAFKGLETADDAFERVSPGWPERVPVAVDSLGAAAKHRKDIGIRNNIAPISID
ncbi:MAG: hypothetical protein KKG78_18945 [Alphaproteobacteria bacterium]|nr:hypothetical protein [Alphaproteobacteria bacterium]